MANWKVKEPAIHQIMGTYTATPESLIKVRHEVVRLLETNAVYKALPKFIVVAFKRAQTESQFNNAMRHLYDWADRNLVWLEPAPDAEVYHFGAVIK